MARLRTEKKYFFAGLNLSSPKYSASVKSSGFLEACNISNVKLQPKGGFSVRKGRNSIASISESIDTLHWYEAVTGDKYLMIGAEDKIYADPDAVGTPVLTHTPGLTSSIRYFESFVNTLIYVDGTNTSKKWNGTTWTNYGVQAVAAAPTIADSGVAGNPNGTYIYAYRYRYYDAVTQYVSYGKTSPYSAELAVTSKKINVTYIAPTDTQVTHITIFRKSSVVPTWKELVTKTVAQAAIDGYVYLDDVKDEDLITDALYMFEGACQDSTGTRIELDGVCQWKNRIWGWKGQWLYHTLIGMPEMFINVENLDYPPFRIGLNNSENIIRCFPFANMLVVWTNRRMLAVTGDADPFYVTEMRYNVGLIAPRSVAICDGRLVWLSYDGVYAWDGVNLPTCISVPINWDAEGSQLGLLESNDTYLYKAVGRYVEGSSIVDQEMSYWLSVPYANTTGTNTRTFTYDFRMVREFGLLPEFSLWGLNTYGFQDLIALPERTSISATDTTYYKELQGNKDSLTTDITAVWESRSWDFGVANADKEVQFMTVTGYALTPINIEVIYDMGMYTDLVQLVTSGAEFDVADFDVDYFADGGLIRYSNSCPQECQGNKIAVKVTMTNEAKFDNIELQYTLIPGVLT